METILSQMEAENILHQLPAGEQAEIERDKIRFGEYFIQCENNHYHRVDPINVIMKDGVPELITQLAITVI